MFLRRKRIIYTVVSLGLSMILLILLEADLTILIHTKKPNLVVHEIVATSSVSS